WWVAGDRGRVKVEIILSPERPPKVQGLRLTSVPDPSDGLASIAAQLAGRLGEMNPAWPADLPLPQARTGRPSIGASGPPRPGSAPLRLAKRSKATGARRRR